jgi:hypothetical protein
MRGMWPAGRTLRSVRRSGPGGLTFAAAGGIVGPQSRNL